MKKLFYFLTAGTLLFASCSKDEVPPKTDAQVITESIIQNLPEANVPGPMAGAADSLGSMIQQLVSLSPPAGSSFSTIPHEEVGTNQRRAVGDYKVYTWSQEGMEYIYQLYEADTKYVIDLYFKHPQLSVSHLPYMHLEADKDGQNGFYEIYSAFEDQETGAVDKTAVMNFAWNTDANGTLTYTADMMGIFDYQMVINADGSGTYTLNLFEELAYEAAWDTTGAGWYKSYDEYGQVADQGTF